jgi:hypothetical protein
MSKKHNIWTKEECLQAALKYNRKVDFQMGPDKKFYQKARNMNWLEAICSHMAATNRSSKKFKTTVFDGMRP